MLFSSLITFYSISTGLIGNLTKVTVGTYSDGFDCGADPGVKIKIQKPDRAYCSVPLPSFSRGDTFDVTNLGSCRPVDFDVGLDSINFWINSTEKACVKSLILLFSTVQGQVTFMATSASRRFDYSTTAKHIYSVKNQSRKFKKKYLKKSKRCTVFPHIVSALE